MRKKLFLWHFIYDTNFDVGSAPYKTKGKISLTSAES